MILLKSSAIAISYISLCRHHFSSNFTEFGLKPLGSFTQSFNDL